MAATPTDPALLSPGPLGRWRAFHLFYHGDRGQAVQGFVGPAMARLLGAGLADRFYFIHYGLGGPHLRLRLRAVAGREADLADAATRLAEAFLAASPSTAPVDPAELERRNAGYLKDSGEADAAVYPDNTWREFPPVFEVERYGGEALFPASLEVFALSSLAALELLASLEGVPAGKRIPEQLRFLIRAAWGFAADAAEFTRLAGYALGTWGAAMPSIVERADAVFAQQRAGLVGLLRRELGFLAAQPKSLPPLAAGARHLGRLAAGTDSRERVLSSQMHMSANRIGMRNVDEVYFCRLLARAAGELEGPESAASGDENSLAAYWPPTYTASGDEFLSLESLVSGELARFAAGRT